MTDETLIERIDDVQGVADLRRLVQDYEWFHTVLGLAGNVCFVAGSAMFLMDSNGRTARWLFLLGSIGMLVGQAGAALVRRTRRRYPWARPGTYDDIAWRAGEVDDAAEEAEEDLREERQEAEEAEEDLREERQEAEEVEEDLREERQRA